MFSQIIINTPIQRGDPGGRRAPNRFSGFNGPSKTAKAVLSSLMREITPLKQGVNEMRTWNSAGAVKYPG